MQIGWQTKKKTPHTSPMRVRYGVSFLKILEKKDGILEVLLHAMNSIES